MDKLILENVRCFHGRHEIPLAPLTILVGENSTGKSTVLAAARLALDIDKATASPDFNREPFDWGAYAQIAYHGGTRSSRANAFAIGYETRSEMLGGRPVRLEATFEERDSQPRMTKWEICLSPYSIVVDGTRKEYVELMVSDGTETERQRHPWPLAGYETHAFGGVFFAATFSSNRLPKGLRDQLTKAFSHTLDWVPYLNFRRFPDGF